MSDKIKEAVTAELERRGLFETATYDNLPTDAEFSGDKIPEEGKSEKNELKAWDKMEDQSIKDRNADEEDHEMGSPILASSKKEGIGKVSSILDRVQSIKASLKTAEEEGEEFLESVPDDFEVNEEELDEGEEDELEEKVEEDIDHEEESEYDDLTPRETLEYAIMDIQEAIEALDDVEPQLVEASKRLKAQHFGERIQKFTSNILLRAQAAVVEGEGALRNFKNLTRSAEDIPKEKTVQTDSPKKEERVEGAPSATRASRRPSDVLDEVDEIFRTADALEVLALRKRADEDSDEEDSSEEESSEKTAKYHDDDDKEKKDEMSKDKKKSNVRRPGKQGAAYPPTDAEFTGDKELSPRPEQEELDHWHEGDARGDRDKSKEESMDLNALPDKVELFEAMKKLTTRLVRQKEGRASDTMWVVEAANGKRLGSVTFADALGDYERDFTEENYAQFVSPQYGEEIRAAVAAFGPKVLKTGFADISMTAQAKIEQFVKEAAANKIAGMEKVKEAAMNIVRAFESPDVPDKQKLISYFTDAYGDGEFARELVNAMLARKVKIAKAVEAGLRYKKAYEEVNGREGLRARARRAVDLAKAMASKGLIEATREAISAKAKELATHTDEQFQAVASALGFKVAAPDEDFERHMQDNPEAGITGNPLEGVRDPKAKVDQTENLQPEVNRDAKIASEEEDEEDEVDVEAVRTHVKKTASAVPQMTSGPNYSFGPDLSFLDGMWSTTPNRLKRAGIDHPERYGPRYRT